MLWLCYGEGGVGKEESGATTADAHAKIMENSLTAYPSPSSRNSTNASRTRYIGNYLYTPFVL